MKDRAVRSVNTADAALNSVVASFEVVTHGGGGRASRARRDLQDSAAVATERRSSRDYQGGFTAVVNHRTCERPPTMLVGGLSWW